MSQPYPIYSRTRRLKWRRVVAAVIFLLIVCVLGAEMAMFVRAYFAKG